MASSSALQLLVGPTRLAVGALGGAAAAELLVGPRAHCYVYRPPYDDGAFQSMYGSERQRQLASPKPSRLVGLPAAARLVMPGHVAITAARNVGLCVLLTVNRWLVLALEEEEKAEAENREPKMPELPYPELVAACRRGAFNACVELATQGTRCALDARALARLPPRLARRMVKDLKLSVVRKGRLPFYTRSLRVAKTAAYSEATWWAADFLVTCALEVAATLRQASGSGKQRASRLLLRCSLHAARCCVALAAVSIGYGVGSAAPRLRSLCIWAVPMLASFGVNGFMIPLINRLAPLPPPADAGAGAGLGAGTAAAPPPRAPQQAGGGFVLVGQQLHPGAAAAMAGEARAAAAAQQQDGPLPNGVAGGGEGLQAAAAPEAAAAPGAAAVQGQQDAGMQAGVPGAAEPPIPAPQQRRVVGGPRLPERPARRHAAAGPGPEAAAGAAAAAAAVAPLAPPPAAPHTPQFRDQRAPTPAGDSEEAEVRAAAAAAAAAAAGGLPAGGGAGGSQAAGGASPSGASGSGQLAMAL